MSFSVGLYRDFARRGGPTFRTVPSAQFSDNCFNSPRPTGLEHTMPKLNTTRHDFLQDRQGRTVADMLNHSEQPSTLYSTSPFAKADSVRYRTPRLIKRKSRWPGWSKSLRLNRPSKTSSPRNPRMAPSGHDRRWTLRPN